jgi:hypothetical protein
MGEAEPRPEGPDLGPIPRLQRFVGAQRAAKGPQTSTSTSPPSTTTPGVSATDPNPTQRPQHSNPNPLTFGRWLVVGAECAATGEGEGARCSIRGTPPRCSSSHPTHHAERGRAKRHAGASQAQARARAHCTRTSTTPQRHPPAPVSRYPPTWSRCLRKLDGVDHGLGCVGMWARADAERAAFN